MIAWKATLNRSPKSESAAVELGDERERGVLDVGLGLERRVVLLGDDQPPVRIELAQDVGAELATAEKLAGERVELGEALDGLRREQVGPRFPDRRQSRQRLSEAIVPGGWISGAAPLPAPGTYPL